MELTGKVIKLLDVQKFASKREMGKEIVKYSFVVETQGQYPKKVCFTVMGEERFQGMNIALDASVNVSFDAESREWNGRWFTELVAWRVTRLDGTMGTQQSSVAPPHSNDNGVF